jgi:hypothetical protein
MNMKVRLTLASLSGMLWFGYGSPKVMDYIQQQRSLGVDPASVDNVQDRLTEDTGDVDEELAEMINTLSELKVKEEERLSAMMALVERGAITAAQAGLNDLPPPRYRMDHRFFEPLVPELTAMVMETYGYAVAPLAEIAGPPPPGERSDHLGILLSLVHHRLLSDEHAAQILQGSFDMNALQVKRMAIEIALRKAFTEEDNEDSGL